MVAQLWKPASETCPVPLLPLARQLLLFAEATRRATMRAERTLENLVREAEEARLREALVEATGEDILDRAKDLAQTVEQRVRQITQAGPTTCA
jgi:hypothetical protein